MPFNLSMEDLEKMGNLISELRSCFLRLNPEDLEDEVTKGRLCRLSNEIDDITYHRVASINQRVLERMSNRMGVRIDESSDMRITDAQVRSVIRTMEEMDRERISDLSKVIREWLEDVDTTKTIEGLAERILERGDD